MNELQQYGQTLLDNGYTPLPIKRGQKRPAITEWSTVNVTPDTVQQWITQGLGGCGVGLRGGDLSVVDIDIKHKDMVKELIQWCRHHVGEPMIRVGEAPKVALFFRTLEPASRRDSTYYDDAVHEHAQHIEIRGVDTQTVGFGTHPDTAQPYKWLTQANPLNTPLDQLPILDLHQVAQLFELFDHSAKQRGWALQAENTGLEHGEGDWMKGKYEIELSDLAVALGHIKADDYHRWVSVGMALYHQYDGSAEALDMWDAWSAGSDKYLPEACERKWQSFHTAGRQATVTLGSILQWAAAAGWHNPGLHKPDNNEFPEPASDDPLAPYRIGRLLNTPAPPVKWLIRNFMPSHKVCLLVAPGGTGKSMYALQMAFSVATGAKLCGYWENIEPGGVLVISAEDDIDDTHRRLEAIYSSFEDDFSLSTGDLDGLRQAATARLFHISMVGKNARFTHKDGSECTPTQGVDKIIAFAQAIPDLKLILIDPVSRFRGGDENSQEDVTRFVEQLERIRMETSSTVLALHHANKAAMRDGGADQQYASRGASALTDGVRWQANMASLHPDEAIKNGVQPDQAGHFVRLAIPKTNYTAPQSGIWLNRGHGGVLTFTQMKQHRNAQTAEEQKTTYDQLLDIIDRRAQDGKPISYNQLRREYGGKDGPLGIPINSLRQYLDALEIAGRIMTKKGGNVGGGDVYFIVKEG